MPPKKRNPPTKVQPPTKKTKLDKSNLKPSQSLYIQNLNDKIKRTTLRHNLYLLFSTYGDVIEIRLARGYAHLLYGDVPSATLAFRSLQSEMFFDKPLNINYSINESKLVSKQREPGPDPGPEQEEEEEEEVPGYEQYEQD
ncbi:putative U2 small nuclear ribonucleoprotein B'' [Spathaspora sp. JA1]|nr:putative U2 small nuclear ribonucleoprotein B'' [Spathaspora sp. JA1]